MFYQWVQNLGTPRYVHTIAHFAYVSQSRLIASTAPHIPEFATSLVSEACVLVRQGTYFSGFACQSKVEQFTSTAVCLSFGPILKYFIFCDLSEREKDWRSRARGVQAT